MQLRIIITVASLVSLLGCSNMTDIVKGEAPFVNKKCIYTDFLTLKSASKSSARAYGLKAEFNLTNTSNGVFSILLWKKDFNIILAGIPLHNEVYFTAIKRGTVSMDDRQIAQSISKHLPLSCARTISK
jgi:hypothetical protein